MTKLIISLFVILSGSAWAKPHLDLEMTSAEYASQLRNQKSKSIDDPAITAAINLGVRLSKWIATVNASRSADGAIRLTSAQTRRGIPISAPSIYSPEIIKAQSDKILNELPEAMRSVLLTNSQLPTSLGIDDATFITHARLLDKNYQNASRYKLVNAYRAEYTRAAAYDVRGYYYLKENKISADDLKDVRAIEAGKLKLISDALYKNCLNSGTKANTCKGEMEMAVRSNLLVDFYTKYFKAALDNWNGFFVIPTSGRRSDLVWSGSILTVPFNTPEIPKFIPYLQNNIEDEFRFGTFKLKMNFGTFANGPRLVFEAGVTPNVNGLGGNIITMDSNQPIEEYESQWTIRHEFGHVLGLPDCYHEFYDTNLKAFVNYQLDITDLMCSRAGNMNERIYKELTKAYGK